MALRGIRVIEVAGLAPVPFCGMILSDFGATVIRVDKVGGKLQPDTLARGKKSIALDLKKPEGKSIVRKLSGTADVFLDPFRPGVMEKLKLGPGDLMAENPKLIYGRISGYGQMGPYSQAAGHDINYASLSGVLSALGGKSKNPTPPVNLLADFAGGGLTCAFGVVLALLERSTSGMGQVVDTSMTEGAAYVGSFLFKSQHLPIWGQPRGKNWLDGGAHFYNTYETKDGKFMATGAIEPQFYHDFMKGLGFEDDDLAENQFGDFEASSHKVAERFRTKTQAEWIEIFDKLDACVTPVLEMNEAPQHPQNQARKAFTKNPFTDAWEPEPAPRLSRTPGKAALRCKNPDVGEHSIEILEEAGYDASSIQMLMKSGVIESCGSHSKL